ncbi:hypothetical protein GWK47_006505 [Chionoecetes opilio]|uniref:Uncharacterized protein n=1 Tax=Chionoecetes opilio TaxID=41210 RepID=A0A8J4Y6Q2_CHIOP|nr:hypothetical protein GWK47_006505 [Chionoecetes opilio]
MSPGVFAPHKGKTLRSWRKTSSSSDLNPGSTAGHAIPPTVYYEMITGGKGVGKIPPDTWHAGPSGPGRERVASPASSTILGSGAVTSAVLSTLARKIATTLSPSRPFTACRLIPPGQKPRVQTIGIGESYRVVVKLWCRQGGLRKAGGTSSLRRANRGGSSHHAMRGIFAQEDVKRFFSGPKNAF